MTSQEFVTYNLVPAAIKVAAAQPPLMTIMELLKQAFIAGASTNGTQWSGKLSIEDDNRWVNFAADIERNPAAAYLLNPLAQSSAHQGLIAELLVAAENLDCEATGAGDACREAITLISRLQLLAMGWRDMESAPLDGKHCILAIQEDAFIWAVQGAYNSGEWNVIHRGNVKPLCWMPNVRLPKEFLPENFR
jgi:hypothetical protein